MVRQIYPKRSGGVDASTNTPVTIAAASVRLPHDLQSQYRPLLDGTTTVLAGGATYTGPAVDISDVGELAIMVFSDQAGSGTAGDFRVEFSGNTGTNWDAQSVQTAYAANATPLITGIKTVGNRARLVYKNGATLQGSFRLQLWGRVI